MRARAIVRRALGGFYRPSLGSAQLAHDQADDAPKPARCHHCGRPSTEGVDASGRHLCQRCVDAGICVRCGEEQATQERDGRRVCIDCAHDIDCQSAAGADR